MVRGLTTAASIWLAAAIGMACGSGLIPLAVFATALHFVAVFIVAPLGRLLPVSGDRSTLLITYEDGRGALRDILAHANSLGCETTLVNTKQHAIGGRQFVRARMRFRSGPALPVVMTQLSEAEGVVSIDRFNRDDDEL